MAKATLHRPQFLRIICGAGWAMLLTISPAAADWKAELTRQMQEEHACKVEYLSHVVERRRGDKTSVQAKVHCEDQRAFDVARERPLQRFTVRKCEVQKSC